MPYTIEFQPEGIRLMLDEPTLLLDAVRQAGIEIRADCGGRGICCKCLVRLVKPKKKIKHTATEIYCLNSSQRVEGFHLACEVLVNQDIQVYIPQESVISGQVLQVEGQMENRRPEPAVTQKKIRIKPPDLEDPASISSRILTALGEPNISIRLNAERLLPGLLVRNDWTCNLIKRGKVVFHATQSAYDPLLGLAVDVGSTKIACFLMDLNSGETLAAKGSPNPQIAFGEDIMTRLGYALKNNRNACELHDVLIQAINQTASELTNQIDRSLSDIADICLVGNTAMHHFFLDAPVRTLAFSPFIPAINKSKYPPAEAIGLTAMPGARVFSPPVIAGFIGSDHLAFLLSAGFFKDDIVRLGIDIGTNTEIALQAGSRIISVSTASGPAFEGAHIRFGMRAAPGAIEHVNILKDGTPQIDVIGGVNPVGICGSGILDALSGMRKTGILNQRSRLTKESPFVKKDADNKLFFPLSGGERPISLSQKDIDQVLLAKGAIRAGIDILLDAMSLKSSEIDEVLIAGAFGSFMRPEHAIGIGMIPLIDLTRIHAVGNAAGAGARMMLISRTNRAKAEKLAGKIEYLELAIYPDFPLFYARGIQA